MFVETRTIERVPSLTVLVDPPARPEPAGSIDAVVDFLMLYFEPDAMKLLTSLWEAGPATAEELSHRTGVQQATVRRLLTGWTEGRLLKIDDLKAAPLEIRYRLPRRMGMLLLELDHPDDSFEYGEDLAA